MQNNEQALPLILNFVTERTKPKHNGYRSAGHECCRAFGPRRRAPELGENLFYLIIINLRPAISVILRR